MNKFYSLIISLIVSIFIVNPVVAEEEMSELDEQLAGCQSYPAGCEILVTPNPQDLFKDKAGKDLPSDNNVTTQPNPNEAPSIISNTAINIINLIFKIAGLLGMIAATVSGVMMVISKDNEEMLNKAKNMIYYTALGFVIIAAAYALILGISNLKLG